LVAATILGQGKNAWQAEIDAAAEVSVDGSSGNAGQTDDDDDGNIPRLAGRLFPLWGEVC